jgi:Family of unknown function (DUF6519)
MRGDFSRSGFDRQANVDGVLHQQGRVFSDADWNEQTWISDRWQQAAARAAIGDGVAAVPAADADALLVVRANASGGEITLDVNPGQVWAGGLLAHLRPSTAGSGAPERRTATYLAAPGAGGPPGAPGSRDAVVLELWREALNGFQVPQRMIEPALGGIDTTERIWHGLAFRLLRLGSGEGCDEIGDRLEDDLAARRRLTVSLAPTQISNGACPVVVGGGYSGFEHDLYRVEIAEVAAGGPMFKTSRFNGGLVGRGSFDPVARKLTIRANRQPILRSGLQSFYLEAFEPLPQRPAQPAPADPERTADLAEEWRLVYGARAVLASDEEIDLTEDLFGGMPGGGRAIFFRLWDDILAVDDFAAAAPVELRDGIELQFRAAGPVAPGDYWTFPLRAGDVGNPQLLIDDRPPEGPERIRVPLGVLRWGPGATVTHAAHEIEDCRKPFRPLSDLAPGCCVTVAPGDDVVRTLRRVRRAGGGCLCLLPGEHRLREPLSLAGAADICIEGFGLSSRLVAGPELGAAPVFDLARSANVRLHDFAVVQRGAAPVLACEDTNGLELERMLVVSRVTPGAAPPIEIRGIACAGWRLQDSILLGTSCVRGVRLTAGRVTGNLLGGVERGIDVSDLLDVVVAGNRFVSLPADAERGVDALLGGDGAAAGLRRLLEQLERQAAQRLDTRFIALRASGMFDVEIDDNLMTGRAGLLGEIVENATVDGNRILTSAIGVSLGLAHGVRFSSNRIGEARSGGAGLSPRVGLRVLGDASDLRIVENRFLDVRDAIVFESDASGDKDVLRLAEVDFRAFPTDDRQRSRELLAAAKAEVLEHRAGTRLIASPFVRLGRCERTLIEGNVIQADGVGLEWSGTKDVRDFRVSRNAFAGCRGGAILIEPDDRVHYAALAEAVDTQVRLIDGNRFDILGIAVRSTLGAVRVERNDVRIRPAPATFVPLDGLVGLLTAEVFKQPPFVVAAAGKDIGNLRLGAKDAAAAVRANPASIDTSAFVAKAKAGILDAHRIDVGDVLTDHAFVLSKLALAGEPALVASGSTAVLAPVIADLEAFVVNLSGIQNEVTDNNVLSRNAGLDGGVVLQQPSGSITGNEIDVGRVAAMVTAKAAQTRRDLRVEGNTLNVTGPPPGDGRRAASYALAIPTLTAGNYSILDNAMDGSVMIGAEPFASTGLAKQGTLAFGSFVHVAHVLAFDGKSYSSAVAKAATPAIELSATAIDPKLLAAITGSAVLAAIFDTDPHRSRTVIQFSDNRVVRGFVALARSTGGAFWTKDDLQREAATAPIIQLTGNVFDYWARVVGRDVLLVGNHSQTRIEFRAGNRIESVANMPAPAEF